MNSLPIEEYSDQVKAKYGRRRTAEFTAEYPGIAQFYKTVLESIHGTYTIDKVLAVGGSGVVHLGHHNRFPQQIVLKFNRPLADVGEGAMVIISVKQTSCRH